MIKHLQIFLFLYNQTEIFPNFLLYGAFNFNHVHAKTLPTMLRINYTSHPWKLLGVAADEIKKVCQRTNSPRYYISLGGNDQQGMKSEQGESRVVVQMDTESPVLYQKACLDYHFDKPLKVTGDACVVFYQKSIEGGRLFYTCFNTAFIRNSLLQFTESNLDKMGHKGKSVCGPAFGLELLFGPANPEHISDYNG